MAYCDPTLFTQSDSDRENSSHHLVWFSFEKDRVFWEIYTRLCCRWKNQSKRRDPRPTTYVEGNEYMWSVVTVSGDFTFHISGKSTAHFIKCDILQFSLLISTYLSYRMNYGWRNIGRPITAVLWSRFQQDLWGTVIIAIINFTDSWHALLILLFEQILTRFFAMLTICTSVLKRFTDTCLIKLYVVWIVKNICITFPESEDPGCHGDVN